MNRIIRLGLTAIAVTFLFNAAAVTETKAQLILNEILKRMEAHKNALTSLKASVTMVKHQAQLGVDDTIEGTVMYIPAKGREFYVRIDWVKPAEETFSLVKQNYVIYRPRLKQAITGNINSAKEKGAVNGPLDFMSMSKEDLKANYSIRYMGQEDVRGGIPTWHLELTPKTENKFKLAELWVDGNGMPIQNKVVEKNDDSTTILLYNLQKNVNISTSAFKIVLPKDTQIIKH